MGDQYAARPVFIPIKVKGKVISVTGREGP
jgi:hypothetical protein